MPSCGTCKKTQSTLNKGELCKTCHASYIIAPHKSSTFTMPNEEVISKLAELPVDWINQSFQNRTGGHLLNIVYHATSKLQSTRDDFVNRVTTLESLHEKNLTIIKVLNDSISEMEKNLTIIKVLNDSISEMDDVVKKRRRT